MVSIDGKEWLKNNLNMEVESIMQGKKTRPSSAIGAHTTTNRNLNKATSHTQLHKSSVSRADMMVQRLMATPSAANKKIRPQSAITGQPRRIANTISGESSRYSGTSSRISRVPELAPF